MQSGFPHCPNTADDEDKAEEERAGGLAQENKQAGDDQRDTRQDKIEAAAECCELPTANGEEQARSDNDGAEHEEP
ncbi:hypothetical protein D3C80_2047380 [compost metagenome]